MKKKLVALLAAAVMLVSLLPAAFAASEVTTEQALIDAVAAGGEVNLGADITLSGPLSIDKAVTINGGNHTLTYTGNDAAIAATSNNLLTVNDLNITAAAAGADGISLSGTAPKLTVNGCVLTVNDRGVNDFPADYNNLVTGAAITVLNSTIQCSRLPSGQSYETWATVGDTRGLSLTDLKAAAVTVDNSVIQGFGYSININGHSDSQGVSDTQNTLFTITNSTIRGWAAINIWSINATYNITNSHLMGINVATSGQTGFSTIALNNGIYGSVTNKPNVFNIMDGSIQAYKYSSNADLSQNLIRVEAEGQTKFNFDVLDEISVILEANETEYGVFITAYPGMSDAELANWFESNVTGWEYVEANVPPYVGYAGYRMALKPYIPHEGGMIK